MGFFSKKRKIMQRPLSALTEQIEAIPVCCSEETSLKKAIALMNEAYIGSILVTNQAGKIIGIFTERDLLYKVAPHPQLDLQSITIAEYMTPSPDMLRRDDPLQLALDLMRNRNHRHLIITDERGKLDKVLSMKDILHYLCDLLDEI